MRILIVFHGRLPGGPYPVAGIALRAYTNGLGLAARGVEVCYASRARDLVDPPVPGLPPVHPFEGRTELMALIRTLQPDLILAEGTDELSALWDCDVPIALDLFAPRVLEAQWEGLDASREMLSLLDALARADYFIVTTPRQRYYYLGLLPLAGVDCREDRLAMVPLSVPAELPARAQAAEPVLVSGGVAWPWQDPSWALDRVSRRLADADRGQLYLMRGPYPLGAGTAPEVPLPVTGGPRVCAQPLLNYLEMLELYCRAWCAVDLMAPNLEREIALSFRQLDALRCGVPLLMGTHAPLAELVAGYDAGWVLDYGDDAALDAALDEVLQDSAAVAARSRNAQRLARDRFSAPETVTDLLARIQPPTRRAGRETLSSAAARRSVEASRQEQRLERLALEVETLEVDRAKKVVEIQELNVRVRGLLDTVGRLSTSLEGALHLQRSGVEALDSARDEAQADLLGAQRGLAAAKREVAKKERERQRLLAQRDELEADIARLQQEEATARRRGDTALAEAAQLRGRLQSLEEQLAAAALEARILAGERDKKQREIEQLWEARDRAAQEQARLIDDNDRLRASLDELHSAAEQHALEARKHREEADAAQVELRARQHRLGAVEAEVEQLRSILEKRRVELQVLGAVAGAASTVRSGIQRTLAGRRRKP